MPKTFRNAILRLTQNNLVHVDNEILNLKKGDVFQYTEDSIIKILTDWAVTKDIKYYMIEHDENSDNIHYHIVISFGENSVCSFETLKNKFPYGDIEGCRYGIKACVQYLIHMNNPEKHQYTWDDVITNAPDKLENYKIPGKANMDAKLNNIIQKILSGDIKECDIEKIDSDLYIRYSRKIKTAFEYRQRQLLNNPNRNINVFVLEGPPGVGKTAYCKTYAEKHNKSICFSAGGKDIFGDYAGQDIMVIDDVYYENFKIEDFLKMLDPNTSTSSASRYHNKLFIGDTIFICTNTHIVRWFPYENDILRAAFFRRITFVFNFFAYQEGNFNNMFWKDENIENIYYENNSDNTGWGNTVVDTSNFNYDKNASFEGNPKYIALYTINTIADGKEDVTCYKENDRYYRNAYVYKKRFLKPINDTVYVFNLNKYIGVDTNKNDFNADIINQFIDI